MFDSNYQTNYWLGFPDSNSDILLNLTHWQYWWWFWFTYLLCLYYLLFLKLVRFRLLKFHPKVVTSYKARGKWGDFAVCFLPITWCVNILSNSNFILRMLEWQTESSLFTVRIRGKQWYWIYKIEIKSLLNIGNISKNIGNNKWHSPQDYSVDHSEDYINLMQLKENKKWLRKYLSKQVVFYKNTKKKYYNIRKAGSINTNNYKTIQNEFFSQNYLSEKLLDNTNQRFFKIYYDKKKFFKKKLILKLKKTKKLKMPYNELTLGAFKKEVIFDKSIKIDRYLNKFNKFNKKLFSLNNNTNFYKYINKNLKFNTHNTFFKKALLKPLNLKTLPFFTNLKNLFIFKNNNHLNIFFYKPLYNFFTFKNEFNYDLKSKLNFSNKNSFKKHHTYTQFFKKNSNVFLNNFDRQRATQILYIVQKFYKRDPDTRVIIKRWVAMAPANDRRIKNNIFFRIGFSFMRSIGWTFFANPDLLKRSYNTSSKFLLPSYNIKINIKNSFYSKNWLYNSASHNQPIERHVRYNYFGASTPLKISFTNNKIFSKFNSQNDLITDKNLPDNLYLVIKQKRFIPVKKLEYFKDKSMILTNNRLLELIDSRKNDTKRIFKTIKKKPQNFYNVYHRRLLRTKRILVLPINVNVTLITNSFDVVHSWFIPGLGIKLDCVPGRSTHHTINIDHAGFYYGQCAEICGRYHHHMPIRVCALPFEHFLVWWNQFGIPYFNSVGTTRKKSAKSGIKQFSW